MYVKRAVKKVSGRKIVSTSRARGMISNSRSCWTNYNVHFDARGRACPSLSPSHGLWRSWTRCSLSACFFPFFFRAGWRRKQAAAVDKRADNREVHRWQAGRGERVLTAGLGLFSVDVWGGSVLWMQLLVTQFSYRIQFDFVRDMFLLQTHY